MRRTVLYAVLVSAALSSRSTWDRDVHAETSSSLQLDFLFARHFDADLVDLERRAAWVSEYDLLVALHLQQLSKRSLDDIIDWRRTGASWDTITRRCGMGCNIYYVALPATQELPRPYARPYATWRQQPGADQRLSDEEVRELVLLRALRDALQLNAGEVASRRAAGHSPRAIAAQQQPPP